MTRRHDIDALRVFVFGLLIAYHLGMVYVADWGYHVKSAHQAEWLQWPMIALNRWRMPLLFMISGIALGLAMASRPAGRLALSRSWRLLLPLGFGMLVIVPVQAYFEALANGAVEPGFGAFMARYLQLRPWPEGGWSGAEYGITWNHLWYLAYVWVYSVALLALAPALDSATGQRLRGWLLARHRALWILVPATWLFACLWWLMPRWPESHALVGDWYAHGKYFACFLLGWLVAREQQFWNGLVEMRGRMLALALVAITIELSLRAAGRYLPPGDIPAWALHVNWAMIERMARAAYTWTALLAILGWSRTLLDRPFRWLPRAREAVFPWYILHQSLIVALAFLALTLRPGPGPVLEPLLVAAGTVAGCLLLHEGLIRRNRLLRPLFGLPARHGPAPEALALPTTPSATAKDATACSKPNPISGCS